MVLATTFQVFIANGLKNSLFSNHPTYLKTGLEQLIIGFMGNYIFQGVKNPSEPLYSGVSKFFAIALSAQALSSSSWQHCAVLMSLSTTCAIAQLFKNCKNEKERTELGRHILSRDFFKLPAVLIVIGIAANSIDTAWKWSAQRNPSF